MGKDNIIIISDDQDDNESHYPVIIVDESSETESNSNIDGQPRGQHAENIDAEINSIMDKSSSSHAQCKTKRRKRDDDNERQSNGTNKKVKHEPLFLEDKKAREIQTGETSCGSHSISGSSRTSSKGKNPVSRKNQYKAKHDTQHKLETPEPERQQERQQERQKSVSSSCTTRSTTQELNLPCGNLEKFSHIIFVDLDNWAKFFMLPHLLPNIFVWAFCGGQYNNSAKSTTPLYKKLVHEKRFTLHPKCGKVKNAADFALCVQAARLDLVLPVHIPFTVMSGDKGFTELQLQLASSARKIHLVNPHNKEPELLSAILNSIEEQ